MENEQNTLRYTKQDLYYTHFFEIKISCLPMMTFSGNLQYFGLFTETLWRQKYEVTENHKHKKTKQPNLSGKQCTMQVKVLKSSHYFPQTIQMTGVTCRTMSMGMVQHHSFSTMWPHLLAADRWTSEKPHTSCFLMGSVSENPCLDVCMTDS